MNSGIYKIENLINGKIYIGKSVNLTKRKRDHFNLLKNNKHTNNFLQNSYNKYGSDNFKFSILEICEKENLLDVEFYYISVIDEQLLYNIELNPKNPTHGSKKKINTLLKDPNYLYKLKQNGLLGAEKVKKNVNIIHNNIHYEFSSIAEAVTNLNISPYRIRNYLKYGELDYLQNEYKNRRIGGKIEGVDNNNNKIIFNSIKDAHENGYRRKSVKNSINKDVTYKNYKFRYQNI